MEADGRECLGVGFEEKEMWPLEGVASAVDGSLTEWWDFKDTVYYIWLCTSTGCEKSLKTP